MRRFRVAFSVLVVLVLATSCDGQSPPVALELGPECRALCEAALDRTRHGVRYDPAYVRLEYPGGDVAADRGVCTDVVIRSYRAALGQDLQVLVHEDMTADFGAYPKNWGLSRPDRNIDHRRVPNLQAFWRRAGAALPVSRDSGDYLPGDLVTWSVGGLPHVGLVVDRVAPRSGRWMIVHNIGAGPRLEDCLFDWPVTGHFRWLPAATAPVDTHGE